MNQDSSCQAGMYFKGDLLGAAAAKGAVQTCGHPVAAPPHTYKPSAAVRHGHISCQVAWAICRNPIPYPNPVLSALVPEPICGSGSSRVCGGPRRMPSCSLILPHVLLRLLLRCDLPSAVCTRRSSACAATSLSCLSPLHSCSCGCRSDAHVNNEAAAAWAHRRRRRFCPARALPPPAMPCSPRLPEYSRLTRIMSHRRPALLLRLAHPQPPCHPRRRRRQHVVTAWVLTLQPPRGFRRSVRRGPKRCLRCCDLCCDLVRGAPGGRQPPGPAPHLGGKTASHTQQPPLGLRRCCISPACIPAGGCGRACRVSSCGRVCHVRLWCRRWRSLPNCQVHASRISSCPCCARRPSMWR